MLIHAYRRKLATPVHTGMTLIGFEPNEAGDVVAEVADAADVALLLGIGEAYRPYLPADPVLPVALALPAPVPALVSPPAPVSAADRRFVLLDGDESLDLAALSDVELRAFAKENGVRVHWKLAGDRIRQVIVDAFMAPAGEGVEA